MTKRRNLPKSWTTVTPFSKAVALSMFITFPVIAFYVGVFYQKNYTPGYCSPPESITRLKQLP